MIIRKSTFTIHFVNSDTSKQFHSLEAAMSAASTYVGNNSFAKPFPHEETYFFGPGDGTTSVVVRQDIAFI